MSLVHRFIEQLRNRGLTVQHRGGDTLILCGPAAEKTPEILRACKAYKPELLRFLGVVREDAGGPPKGPHAAPEPAGDPEPEDQEPAPAGTQCPECRAWVYDREATTHLCNQVGTHKPHDGSHGRCPYKGDR